jgi:hypothetical protein
MVEDEFITWLKSQSFRTDRVGQLGSELISEPSVSHLTNYELLRVHIFNLAPYEQPALYMLIDAKTEFDEINKDSNESETDVL